MQTMVARELSLSKKIQIFKELSLNTEVNLMEHATFLHQWADTGNQETLFLMVHATFLHHWTDTGNQETLFLMEHVTFSTNGQTPATRKPSFKETEILTETRRGDKRRKRPRNYAALRMCTVPHVRS